MKKFKIEYLIYLFLILSPILDASACIFRNIFPNAFISPSAIIRPIIPIVLLLYIFIKDKKMRTPLFISGILYLAYALIHLLVFKSFNTKLSYGSIFGEAQYLINYIYMIYVLFIILYLKKKKGLPALNKYMLIMLLEYMAIIYFSVLTKTSYPTYVEGIGYRSYFTSGNTIATILIILYGTILEYIINNKNKIGYVLIVLLGIYLIFLIGTRTGLFGFLLVTGIYVLLEVLFNIKNIYKNKIFKYIIPFLIILIIGVFLFGSKTLERRKLIKEEANTLIDINTGKPGYTTGDTSKFIYKINNNLLEDGYMSNAQKKSYKELYKYANKHKILPNNTRRQQLVYNMYLVKNQKSLKGILFGNGYLNNYGELILEMEIPAIILNFGLIGTCLFLAPFISYLVIFLVNLFKKKVSLTKEKMNSYMMLILSLTLSCLAGYVLFSSTCVLLIIINISKLKED